MQGFTATLTDKQALAWNTINRPEVTEIMYGGAKGGGKSHFLCVWIFCEAMRIARKFSLMRCDNPVHVGWMGRKQATDFAGTTLQTWRQVIPSEYYELKGGTERDIKHIIIDGRVCVDYGGLDKQEHIQKFNSAEYCFIAIDQAEETNRDEVAVLRASRRMKINDQEPDYKGLYTANPAQCWLKDEFVDAPTASRRFVQALPADNPHLPESYIETLRDSFGHRPELIEAYLHGSWEAFEGDDQVILERWIIAAMTRERSIYDGKVISCDPARFGDDETVIYVFDGTRVIDEYYWGKSKTTMISNKIEELSRHHGNCAAVVDEIGVGGGVVDELKDMGVKVISFNSSAASSMKEDYYNLRAEAWMTVSKMFNNNQIAMAGHIDYTLKKQLLYPRYEFKTNGKIIIEGKDKIKQRLGCSPDRADAYVMGLWAVKNIESAQQGISASEHQRLLQKYRRTG